MNTLFLIGRLVTDPQYKENVPVVNFRIAVKRRFSKTDATDFFDIVAYNKTAEYIAKYFVKGRTISIKGKLQNNNYEKDGAMVYKNIIIATEVQ